MLSILQQQCSKFEELTQIRLCALDNATQRIAASVWECHTLLERVEKKILALESAHAALDESVRKKPRNDDIVMVEPEVPLLENVFSTKSGA